MEKVSEPVIEVVHFLKAILYRDDTAAGHTSTHTVIDNGAAAETMRVSSSNPWGGSVEVAQQSYQLQEATPTCWVAPHSPQQRCKPPLSFSCPPLAQTMVLTHPKILISGTRQQQQKQEVAANDNRSEKLKQLHNRQVQGLIMIVMAAMV